MFGLDPRTGLPEASSVSFHHGSLEPPPVCGLSILKIESAYLKLFAGFTPDVDPIATKSHMYIVMTITAHPRAYTMD